MAHEIHNNDKEVVLDIIVTEYILEDSNPIFHKISVLNQKDLKDITKEIDIQLNVNEENHSYTIVFSFSL